MGGGGLIAGVSAAHQAARAARARRSASSPTGAAKMTASLAAGQPVTLDKTASIADGLLTMRPGDLTFAHVQAFVDDVVTVPDEAIDRRASRGCSATRGWWWSRAARSTTAAIMLGLGGVDASRGPVVAIVSGGNVEPEQYAELHHATVRA